MPPNDSCQKMTAEFVVVARDEDDARAFARFAQYLLHDVVVRLRPIPAPAELPAVDDVTDEVQEFGFRRAQEIDQMLRLTARRSQVKIRYPDRPESKRAVGVILLCFLDCGWAHGATRA